MDLRQYFKKIRDVEASIHEDYPLIVSLGTSDGGKAGMVIEVSRQEAAKAIAENRAVIANDEQKSAYYASVAELRNSYEKAELSRRLQVAILSDTELRTTLAKQEKHEGSKGSR